jgi:hypothetical protein
VSNYLETGGAVLTPEHNREAHDPHDREGEQSQPSRSRCRPSRGSKTARREPLPTRFMYLSMSTSTLPRLAILGPPRQRHGSRTHFARGALPGSTNSLWSDSTTPHPCSKGDGLFSHRSTRERRFPARSAVFLGLNGYAQVQEGYRQRQGQRLRCFRVPLRGLRTVPQTYP